MECFQSMTTELAGRSYARVYRVQGRRDIHSFLLDAVQASGGEVLFASPFTRAPIYVGIGVGANERIGLLAYPFRCSPEPIKGRAPNEHRMQVRYGGEETWKPLDAHRLGIDVAGVDVTIVIGVHLKAGILVGLDPVLYDPLPMGISIEFKDAEAKATRRNGWAVWERETHPGRLRPEARSRLGLETLVGFTPERLLDYVRFERYASSLGLDPPLRFKAAEEVAVTSISDDTFHRLERQFGMSSRQVLDLITRHYRLEVAVRGGVAEHHLQEYLERAPDVRTVRQIDEDGQPDFDVTLVSGRGVTIECKNVSPKQTKTGGIKVEVQKTRASKGDPASRFYRLDQFDVVAACLWPVTGRWEYRFKATAELEPHRELSDRVTPIQIVDDTWARSVTEALQEP